MLVNEAKKDNAIIHQGQPWIILSTLFKNPGRGISVYTLKMRNLKSGNITEITLKSGEAIAEANLERKKCQYLYKNQDSYTFMDTETYDQFELNQNLVGDQHYFMLEGQEYYIMMIDGVPCTMQLPPKVDLKVTVAPPGDRGDTSGNALKDIETETGYQLRAPLFIKVGDAIRVNTETGEYCEKAN